MPARATLVVAAAAVVAWLGIGLHQWRNQDRAERTLRSSERLTSAQLERVDRLLRRAGRLNPDRRPRIERGIAALRAGRPRAARRILLDVTRAEPEGIEAWAWLRNAAEAEGDRALARLASRRILRLRPPLE